LGYDKLVKGERIMNKKKIGLIVVVLFLLIGLGSFVFANPNEEENLKKKGKDIEETETIKDKDSGEDKSTETTDDDGNQALTNNNATRTINNNRNNGNNGNNNGSNNNGGTGNIVVDNGYDEALKAVEKAESSFTQDDVDNAEELVDKVADPQGKEELKDRLDAVQDAIDADKLVTELENKVKNSNNITDMNSARDYRTESEVEKIVSELKDSTLKDELEKRLETVGKILNDNDSPIITGINDNSFARKNVTLTIEDANDVTTKVTLDSKEIEYTGTFTEEGTYVVTVVDEAFNEKTITFTIDKTAPTVTGATNGGYYRKDVTLTITEENIQDAKYQYNGKWYSFESGHIFTEEGTYFVRVTDKAYNKKAELTFTIDKTAPTVTGVEDGAYYHEDVTPIIEDENLQNVVVKYNGKKLTSYKLGDTLTKEGTYQIRVTDKAGNKFDYITFIIDKTPASRVYSTLDFDKSGKQYYENDGEKVYYVKNGDSFTFRMQFSEALKTAPTVKVGGMVVPMTLNEKFLNNEGKYIYEGTVNITQEAKLTQGRLEIVLSNVIDLAGNESTDEVVLNQTPTSNGRVVVYDVTSPGPTILGITGFFNENEDAHYITYGKKVRVLTYYKEKLSVNPVVKIGNKEFETYYTEDSSDLKNGVYAYYADIAITEDLGLNEGEIPFTVSGHKDLAGNEGREYTNADITYDENDKYENRFNKVVLDNTNPSISIEGTTGEKYWFREQTFNVVVTEANLDNIYYAWNQSSNDKNMHNILDSDKATKVESKDIIDNGDGTYTVKITIAKEGRYVLNVKAVDKAGNSTYTRKGWYQIDRTDPTIVLHKDKNPEEIKPGVHNYCVSATISDKNLKSTKLNGKDYKSDDFICDDGNHTLVATDKAGNSKTIEFKIDRTYPVITINGVNYTGDTNDAGFFNNIDLKLTEANNYTAWVNDKEVDLTTYDFNKDGNYKVKVVDEASNNTTVNFTVDTVPVTKVELRVNSSNQNNQYAKTGDSFGIYLTVNEELKENPTFTVNGKEYKVNQTETVQSGYKYAVVYTVTKDMDEGEMQFTISNIYDKAGNQLADLSNKDTEQKIVIDNTAPTATITYNTVNPTNRAVIATLNASEEVKILNAGTWNPNSGYATTFKKSYPENKTQTVTIEDKAGNQSTVEVVINNIDKDAPELVIDTIVNGVSNSQNPQVHATDINGFKISVKLNEEEVRNDTASLNANGIYSSWFGIGYMKDGSYEITATDNLGNSKTIAFELKRSE
jgi:hypothetical protein